MSRVRRLLSVMVLVAASTATAAVLALACSSFTGDTATEADGAPESSTPDAPGTSPDSSADASVIDAAAKVPFCTAEQASSAPHALCADFEGELSAGWRGATLDPQTWVVADDAGLELIEGGAPSQPGAIVLSASVPAFTGDSGTNPSGGNMTFTNASSTGARIAFDMRLDQITGPVTAFDVYLYPVSASAPVTRIYLTLRMSTAQLVVVTTGEADVELAFPVSHPIYFNTWRHFTLEIGGASRVLHMTEDGTDVVNAPLPPGVVLPAAPRLRIGVPYYATGPVRLLWDDVTLDPMP